MTVFFFPPPPFLWTIADCKRKKGHDSALRLLLHPSTELSSSHNKSCGAGQSHNLNQVTVTHHEAHPENSVWQRHSWKQIGSLLLQSDCRYETKYPDFELSDILHLWLLWGCPTWMPAKVLQSGMSLNETRSSRSVINTASPDVIVHPVGLGLCHILFYTLTRIYRLCDTEPAVTDQCSPSRAGHRKVSKMKAKNPNGAARLVLFQLNHVWNESGQAKTYQNSLRT